MLVLQEETLDVREEDAAHRSESSLHLYQLDDLQLMVGTFHSLVIDSRILRASAADTRLDPNGEWLALHDACKLCTFLITLLVFGCLVLVEARQEIDYQLVASHEVAYRYNARPGNVEGNCQSPDRCKIVQECEERNLILLFSRGLIVLIGLCQDHGDHELLI